MSLAYEAMEILGENISQMEGEYVFPSVDGYICNGKCGFHHKAVNSEQLKALAWVIENGIKP